MKNIVTIDFDIFMWQDIETYNGHVDSKTGVDSLLESMPLLEFVRFDAFGYQCLTNFIKRVNEKIGKENIYFITDHNEILKYLPKEEKYNLYNIDHHHDMGYEFPIKDDPHCGNWGYYACKQGNVNDFIWVTDAHGINPDWEIEKIYPIKRKSVTNFSYNYLVENTDSLIICFSPTWVPSVFYPFFELWKDLIDK